MKLAWFTHRYFPCLGGSENFARAMVRRFVAAGHQVDVFTSDAHDLSYFTKKAGRRVDAPAESIVDGARVRRFAVRHYPLQRYVGWGLSRVPHFPTRCRCASYMPLLPGLGRVRGDYDAVFSLGFPFTVFPYAALRTARAAGVPLILIPFLHLATPGDPVHRAYTRPHQVRLLTEARFIVSPTEFEMRALQEWGIPRDRLLHLPMAIDRTDVIGGRGERLRGRLGIPAGAPLVGQLGGLDLNKGTNDLVRAVARINAGRSEDAPVHLILAGTATPRFEQFLAERPVAERRWLHCAGALPQGEVADFYDALDVYAMPSRTDSFGIVFLEAWANGKPVVAAAAGGVVEVVRHEETGLLVPFGAIESLAAAIARLLDDPATARRLGAAGRAQVEQGCTWDERFATLAARVRSLDQPSRTVRPSQATLGRGSVGIGRAIRSVASPRG